MKAQMSATPEGEAVAKPEPPKPASYVTRTQKAEASRKASALRKAEGFKVKIMDLHIQISTIKNKRDRDTSSFVDAADQYRDEAKQLRVKGAELVQRSESLQGEITRLQEKTKLLQNEAGKVLQAKQQVAQDLAATGILLKAALQKADEAKAQDRPKIDQLINKRNKLVERLYHHQLLHPGCIPEKVDTDA